MSPRRGGPTLRSRRRILARGGGGRIAFRSFAFVRLPTCHIGNRLVGQILLRGSFVGQPEREAVFLRLHREDAEFLRRDEGEGRLHVCLGSELRDMREALDFLVEFHERAERIKFYHRAGDDFTLGIFFIRLCPGILLQRFERKGNALALDADDLRPNLLAYFENVRGVGDELPVNLGDVHQTRETLAEANERAKGDDAGDLAFDLVADVVGGEALAERCGLPALLRENQFAVFGHDVKNRNVNLLTDEFFQFVEYLFLVAALHPRVVLLCALGRGEEPENAGESENESAAVRLGNLQTDDFLCFHHALQFLPILLAARLLQRKFDVALVVLRLHHLGRNRITDDQPAHDLLGAVVLAAEHDADAARPEV